MPVENATYISDLNPDWPVGKSDFVSEGDDHIRGMKKSLQNTIPNADGPITGKPTQLNNLTNGINWVDNSATAGAASYFEVTDPTSTDDTKPDAPLVVGTPTVSQYNSTPGLSLTWQALMDIIYPVGRPFMSATDNRDPADILGFGTWSPIVGMIAGVGNTVDGGGAAVTFAPGEVAGTVRVTNDHIVSATLGVAVTMDAQGGHVHSGTAFDNDGDPIAGNLTWGDSQAITSYTTSEAGEHVHNASGSVVIGTGDLANGGQFINPYYGMYIWVRTA